MKPQMISIGEKLNNWQQAHRQAVVPAGLVALLFIAVVNLHNNQPAVINYTPLLFAAVFICLVYAPLGFNKKELIPFGILGVLLAFFATADSLVYTPEGTPKSWPALSLLVWLLYAAVFTLCFCGLSVILSKFTLVASSEAAPPSKKLWCFYFGAIMLLWLPAVLSFGPLRLSADSFNVTQQALGNYPLQDNHPVAYTLLLRLFLTMGGWMGSLKIGAWLFALGQMAFFAGCLSYTLYWLQRQGCPALYSLSALAYFTLSPVFAINSITLWKDIPFNAVLLLLCLALYNIGKTEAAPLLTTKGAAGFLAILTAACFLRGNGFWIVLVAISAICILYRRHWKRWLCLFLPFIVVVQLVLGPLYSLLGLSRLGKVEGAAMPLQQVSRAVKNGAPLTPEQQQLLESIVPIEVIKDYYVSASPDSIKTHPSFNSTAFDEHFGEFLQLWMQLLPTNKQVYLDAWLLETLGYWKVDFHGWTSLTSEYQEDAGLSGHDLLKEITGYDFQAFFNSRTEFFTLSFMAYLVLFSAALHITRRKKTLLFLLPMLTIWAGLMLGAPTYCEFRYMLLFPLALPCVVFSMVDNAPVHKEITTAAFPSQ